MLVLAVWHLLDVLPPNPHTSAMEGENGTITRVPGIRVGHATDTTNVTGCTVLLVPPDGVRCVIDARGGAPGTRETALLAEGSATRIHAIFLSGGSAFGLAAADGVVAWLAERGVGFPTGVRPVPIVPAAILFDLAIGTAEAPSPTMGYAAANSASSLPVTCGSVGAGTGATVGKLYGRARAMQGGIGSAAAVVSVAGADYLVGALVAVNAVGDVRDPVGNRIIAGARNGDSWVRMRGSSVALPTLPPPTGTNTTLGVIATDAPLTRTALTRLAISAHDGLAHSISPAHTAADGDAIFVLTTAPDQIQLATRDSIALSLAVEDVVERSIVRAVVEAVARGELPAVRDLVPPE